ncbi:hypothetical protein GGI26_004185 [Coemansia sp. RSA 1358]|nr:hypothetical protein EDC05_006338 [Coemansia umbellata]KAJ2621403.1 hypothetical protein GGI26_004185 [Coemansia sp. RSA 1358]
MKLITALLLAATAVLAQVQEDNQGPKISSGSSSVSNPNINNGVQLQGSFVDSSSSGQNAISNDAGDLFQGAGGFAPFGAFRRRDAIFNSFGELVFPR